MDFNEINELKPYNLNCNIFDVYTYDNLSMQELLCQFFTKINECVKTSNETIDLVEWLVNEGIKEEVAIKLTNLIYDGTLENLINIKIFNGLNEEVNKKVNEVDARLKKDSIKLEDLHTEVKSAMSGGSVAVVGENTVGTENIKDLAVTTKKVSFDVPLCEKTINLFDKTQIDRNKYLTHNYTLEKPIDGSDRDVSDFIYIEEGETYKSTHNFSHYAFYDLNKNPLSYNANETRTLTPPTNAKYIRFTIMHNYTDTICFSKGEPISGMPHVTPIIADKSIEVEKLNFKPAETIVSKNLFNKDSALYKKFISYQNGGCYTVTDQGNYYASDWIEIEGDTNYCISHPYQTAFYDSDKNYISGCQVPTTPIKSPSNAKYMRTTVWDKGGYIDIFQIEKSDKKTSFVPHLITKIDDNTIELNHLSNDVIKYIEDVNLKENLKISCIGDSITWGFKSGTNGERVTKPYPTILSEKFNFVNNYGLSGSTIAGNTENNTGYMPIVERYIDIDRDSDYIVVFAGTNDFGSDRSRPLGDINSTNQEEFYGALNILCNGLINNFTETRVLFITPLKRSVETIGNKNLSQYVNAIKEVCKKYSFPVLDLYENGNFIPSNTTFKNRYCPDGLHPNQDWYYILADKVEKFIKSN